MRAFLDSIASASSAAAAGEASAKLREHAESQGWEAEEYFNEDRILQENFEHWLPRLSTYSAVILLHALVETQLNTCALRLRRDKALSLDLKDIHGNGVPRAKIYLLKVAGLDIGTDLGWQELLNLQDIRNVIIHRRGRIGDSREQQDLVKRLLKEYPNDLGLVPVRSHGVVNEAEEELMISFRLCRHFLDEIEAFFHRLFRVAGFRRTPIQF